MKKHHFVYHILLLMFLTVEGKSQQATPAAPEWKVAGSLPPAPGQSIAHGVAGPVAGVHNDVLLLAGGANFPEAAPWLGGKKKYYSDGYVFQKASDGSLLQTGTFFLPVSLGYSANCSTPQGIVAAGGENEGGLSNEVLLLQWNEVSRSVVTNVLPSLPFALTNASLAFHQNKLYLAGGEMANAVSSNLLVLDLSDTASGWKMLAPLAKPVSHAVLVIQSGKKGKGLYLLGGRKRNPGGRSDLYASVYHFDLEKGEWEQEKALPYAVSAGTGVAAGPQSILLFGGDTGETFHKAEDLIAAIGKETNEARKQKLNDEKTRVQATHPGFCRQVFLYNTREESWRQHHCIPQTIAVTTTAVKWGNNVYLPSGEIRAGVRTPQILYADLSAFSKH